MTGLKTIDDELAWLNQLIGGMERGMVVTHDGVDVTAEQLQLLSTTVAFSAGF